MFETSTENNHQDIADLFCCALEISEILFEGKESPERHHLKIHWCRTGPPELFTGQYMSPTQTRHYWGAVWQSQGPPKDHGNMDEEQTENNHGIFYTFGCRGVDVPMMFLNTNQRVAPNKVVKEMLHSLALRNANRPLCGFCMLLCLWWFGNLSTKQDILQFLNGHRRSGNLDSRDNQFYQLKLVPPGGSRGVSQELTWRVGRAFFGGSIP